MLIGNLVENISDPANLKYVQYTRPYGRVML
jgi:hypothetical protein